MLRSLLRVIGLDRERVSVDRSPRMPESDYHAVRRVLNALASDGKYFAYCKDDDTFIWQQGSIGPWQSDDDGSRFLQYAMRHSPAREATLALKYFKESCTGSHIDIQLKAERLGWKGKQAGEPG
jgi:hypothetical protein